MDLTKKDSERKIVRALQDLQVLLGQTGADIKPLSALRRGELLPLASMSMKSAPLAAAPTMADFNLLQADVKMIFDAFVLLSNKNGNAKLPGI